MLWMYSVVLVLALVVLGGGIYQVASGRGNYTIMAAGLVSVIAVLLVWFFNINLRAERQEMTQKWEEHFGPVNERLQYISVLLNQVSEQQLISERAKGIAFRESERDALRRAIREDMQRKDYDAALMLANEIESVFGYKQEADRFREEIYNSRDAEVRKIVTEAMDASMDVLACGPEPMLEAVRALAPNAQLAWEAPMACGYGACYGCAVEIDGELKRLCVEGPVLAAA